MLYSNNFIYQRVWLQFVVVNSNNNKNNTSNVQYLSKCFGNGLLIGSSYSGSQRRPRLDGFPVTVVLPSLLLLQFCASKRNHFVFQRLHSSSDLRRQYWVIRSNWLIATLLKQEQKLSTQTRQNDATSTIQIAAAHSRQTNNKQVFVHLWTRATANAFRQRRVVQFSVLVEVLQSSEEPPLLGPRPLRHPLRFRSRVRAGMSFSSLPRRWFHVVAGITRNTH